MLLDVGDDEEPVGVELLDVVVVVVLVVLLGESERFQLLLRF